MPIYDYKCKLCGYEIHDELVSSSDTEIICPECYKDKIISYMEKVIGTIRINPKFNGGGFYETDYKDKKK